MSLKKQIKTIKENWLLAGLLLIAILVMGSIDIGGGMLGSGGYYSKDMMMETAAMSRGEIPPMPYDEGFAPDVEERKITKTAGISTEVERGQFGTADQQLRNIVKSSSSYLLNENINTHGERDYKTGSYQIKVDVEKYDSVIGQLKQIGEVKDFWENADDITARYTDSKVELEAAKAKLERYQKMLEEAEDTEDKITLTDRIFDQERTIKYLEKSLSSMDQRVEYTTISMTINEKQSGYVDVVFVKFSQLVRSLVESINNLLNLLFVVLPWAIAAGIIYGVYKLFRKKKK